MHVCNSFVNFVFIIKHFKATPFYEKNSTCARKNFILLKTVRIIQNEFFHEDK